MSAGFEFLRGVWVLAAAVVFRCWSVLVIAGAVSLVLLHGQGFETVLADLAAAGDAKGERLLWSSGLLAVIVFMSSNVLLGRWRSQGDERYTAFARYTGPLVLSILATWVIPACLVSTEGLGIEELDSLKFGFIVALVGGIAAIALIRYMMSEESARGAGESILDAFLAATPPIKGLGRLQRVARMHDLLSLMRRLGPFGKMYSLIGIGLGAYILLGRRWPALAPGHAELANMLGSRAQLSEIEPPLREMAALFVLVLLIVVFWALWRFVPAFPTPMFMGLTLLAVLVVEWRLVVTSSADFLSATKLADRTFKVILSTFAVVATAAATMALSQPRNPPGAPLAFLLGLAFWVSLISVGVLLAARNTWARRLLAIVAVVATGLALIGPFNEGEVRRLTNVSPSSETLESLIDRWLASRAAAIEAAKEPYPVAIVATEGGGIRAAYWTAGLLASLVDTDERVGSHVLAISAVSGGSVGAGVYAALVSAPDGKRPTCATDGKTAPCVRRILGADLLSPQLMVMLVIEAFRSALQAPPLGIENLADRTAVLEQTIEREFEQATGQDLLAQPFNALWGGTSPLAPLLVVNTTEASSGQRAALAPGVAPQAWADAIDAGSQINPAQVRLSTAMVLSARFPGLSTTAHFADGSGVLRLVDGGYVDNSGAASARDLLHALRTVARNRNLQQRVLPVVIFIRNGDERVNAVKEDKIGRSFAGTLFDPLSTLMGVGTGSARRFSEDLKRETLAAGGKVFDDFRLEYGEDRFPLGWMLAPQTVRRLDDRIKERVESRCTRVLIALLVGERRPDPTRDSEKKCRESLE